ncbi:MAG: methyltransferase domain-containing protein [Thermoguttaceae bacterium]
MSHQTFAPNRMPQVGSLADVHATGDSSNVPEDYFLGAFIPLHYQHNMLLDADRVGTFREAIDHIVQPGDKVLDLGGGTGILSYFAAQKAEKVWCVEFNPALVEAAGRFLADNSHGERVEVVQADARSYLPPEPVDVVICEMLHVGLLREKQVPVIESFKERYVRRYGDRLPTFIPDTSLLAVQAVEQSFDFAGYHAPIPIFQSPTPSHEGTTQLTDPVTYSTVCYGEPLPGRFDWEGTLSIQRDGTLNGLRLVTKNILAVVLDQHRAVEWLNQHLIMPLAKPLAVKTGDRVCLKMAYRPGGSLESLADSLSVEKLPNVAAARRGA